MFAEGVGELSTESGVFLSELVVAVVGFLEPVAEGVVGGSLAGGDGW